MNERERRVRSWIDLAVLFVAAVVIFFVFVYVGSANGAGFQVGIAEPGADVIPSAQVSALGLTVERRSVIYHGESAFSGFLSWTPGLRHIAAVWGMPASAPSTEALRARYCGFVASLLERYPQISDVVIWNEPNLAYFWGKGADAYAQLVQACSQIIRSHGVRVIAPGMSPSTTQGVADFAQKIAARGRHLIDVWDQHDYSAYSLAEKVAAVRAAFGWRVPVLVGESGITPAYLMAKAYCAGAVGWLNFKLRTDGDWLPSGLLDPRGAPNSRWSAFQSTAAAIRGGTLSCASAPPPPAPHQLPSRSERVAASLGEVGGWARDAYAVAP
jgi:hypothetical protein